ncbi:MAG: hypothetical protein SFZ03_04175 [Candidatus Melainabacteria bacterium]|nr:hypothetical protein [Candidatus Melainabacteria bacterium]
MMNILPRFGFRLETEHLLQQQQAQGIVNRLQAQGIPADTFVYQSGFREPDKQVFLVGPEAAFWKAVSEEAIAAPNPEIQDLKEDLRHADPAYQSGTIIRYGNPPKNRD